MRLLAAITLILAAFSFPAFAAAPVGLLDKQGAQLPLELAFRDESGQVAPLATYFHADRPVLLSLVYFGCPGLCTMTLTNLVNTLKLVNPSPGTAFELVVVSIDAREGADLAREKKAAYLKLYARPETATGWHFLTGNKETIDKLASVLGFQFSFDPATNIFAHPSALYVLSPQGVLTATFPGPDFSHKEIRTALFEASEGRVAIFLNRASALCYQYMPHAGLLNSPLRWAMVLALLCGGLPVSVVVLSRRKWQIR